MTMSPVSKKSRSSLRATCYHRKSGSNGAPLSSVALLITLLWGGSHSDPLLAQPEPVASANSVAEYSESGASEVERLWALLISIEGQLHSLLSMPPAPNPLGEVETCVRKNPGEHLADALSKEADAVDSNNGFSVNGFYTSDSITDEDGRAGRGFVELSWELLDQGVRGNNKDAEALRRRAELERLLAGESTSQQRLRCQRDQIHQLFAPLQLDVRSLQLRLLEPVYEYERRAYFKGWSYLDELLVSERDLLLIRRELSYLDDVVTGTASVVPPTIDVNMPLLLGAIDNDGRFAKAKELSDSLSRAQYEAEQRQRLRVFLRQEVDESGNPDDVVAGLRFSVPLGAPRTYALEERLRYNEASASLASWERTAIVRSAYLEVREQLERVIKSQYALERSQERLRRSIAEYRLNQSASLPIAVERLKALLAATDELLSTKEVLYRRIGEMLVHSRLPYDEAFIEFVPIDEPQRGRSGNRSLYLWKDEFAAVDNQRLLDIAASKSLSRLSVSAGQQLDHDKLEDLLRRERRPEVELLLGDALWLRDDNWDAALERILQRMEDYPGLSLHLDIEPQQLPEYGESREELLEKYLLFVTTLRERLPIDTSLRLSVPAHWPMSQYLALAKLAEELSIMAYGTGGDRAIDLAMELSEYLPSRKLRWALNLSDFPSEWQLEEQIRELSRETEVRRFAIHGADGWLGLSGVSNEAP